MFEKNPLQNGVSRNINEYSQDLEDRVETTFEGVTFENLVNIEMLASLGIDFPIEQGPNYTKWNSGKLECWGYELITPVPNTPTSKRIEFPIDFVGNSSNIANDIIVTLGTNSSSIGTKLIGYAYTRLGKTGMDLVVNRTNDTSSGIDWSAIGRWK